MGVPKLPKLRLLRLWAPITLRVNLWLRWGLKKSCSPRWELSNNMSHATFTQRNRVDSWLLGVGNQIANLTPDHNLCFKYPNGSCEPILDIYVSIVFQCYKELLNLLGFDLCNRSLNIRESTETLILKVRVPLGVWGFIPHTFLHSREHVASFLGFLLGPQTCKPLLWLPAKARVASPMENTFLAELAIPLYKGC
jgi:hypothetical protein